MSRDVLIYRGHNHFVMCDGLVHRATSHLGTETQCRCFCRDADYLSHGFTPELIARYAL